MEDKQKAYREKVLKEIEDKNNKLKLKQRERTKSNQKYVRLEHEQKVKEFKKLNPNKELVKRMIFIDGEYKKIEICQLLEDNICNKERVRNENKWKKINEWKEKMQKAGIKAKPRRYFKSPTDLSIHTHSKCKVPVFAKRKGE